MIIDDLLNNATAEQELVVPNTWNQGRTIYGGLSAALVVAAISKQVNPSHVLRSIHVNFSGPSNAGEAFKIECNLLREGKSVSQWNGQLIQNGTVCVQVTTVFGIPSDSSLMHNDFVAPKIPSAEKGFQFPKMKGPDGGFSQHIDLTLSAGDPPISNSTKTEMGGWMRFNEAPNEISPLHLIVLIDVWPPANLPMLKSMRAGSTVSWSVQFAQPLALVEPDQHLGYLANVEHSQDSYTISQAKVWNNEGKLLALSQQTIIVYE